MEQTKPTYEELEALVADMQNRLDQAELRGAELCAAAERTKEAMVLEAIMDNFPEGITVADRDTQTIVMQSRYGTELAQCGSSHVPTRMREGLAALGMYRPDSDRLAEVEELPLWRATMKGEAIKEEEWLLTGGREEPVALLVSAAPLRDSRGRITGGIAVWRDVTGPKKLEMALQQREQQFFHIFNMHPDAMGIVGSDTGIMLEVNDAYMKKMGYSHEESLRTYSWQVWKDKEAYREFRRILDRDGEVHDFEAVGVTKSGEDRYFLLSAKRLKFGGRRATLVVSHDLTERRQAEEALRQSQEMYRELVEAASVLIIRGDLEGRITFLNDYAKKVFKTDDSAIGKTLLDLADFANEEDREIATAQYTGIVRNRVYAPYTEALSLNKQGGPLWVGWNVRPLTDAAGNVRELLAVGLDITERKLVEEALRQSERNYRELVETAAVLIVRTDLEGRVTFINDYAKKFLHTDETAIGMPVMDLFDFVDEKSRETVREQLRNIREAHLPIPLAEAQTITRDGQRVWTDWTIKPVRDAEGNVKEMLGVGLDVSERKRAEQALRENEMRLRTLLEAIPALVWTVLPPGKIDYVNQRWLEYKGTLPDENWLEAIHPDDRLLTMEATQRSTLTGELFQVEHRLRRHDGVYRWHLSRAVPLRNDKGDVYYWYGSSMDIHDQKLLEQDLRRVAAELERSNRELEEFAYVASHDLQEPLRMITGYLQLIERRYKDRLDSDADEFIAFAVDGAARMQRLIADLLAYSRVSTRGHPLVPTDLNAAFERARADLWTMIVETGAKVTNDPLPTVNGDETQLSQLFLNLIGNAIKFRSDKPPEIHVGVSEEDSNYVFSVRDNGVGFEPKYAPRIFQVFQRLHTRDKYPGTGIGLAICKKIVDRHGGRIWADSEPGKGSTFYFTLPKPGEA